MRKNMVETAALAALLLGAVLAWGQQAGPTPPKTEPVPVKDQKAKSKLEEMLQKALQDNPDVRLAAAKLAEAEAELNRARLLVVQKVATQYQAVEAQNAAVEGAAAELDELQKAAATGGASAAQVRAAEQKLIDAKAKLATLEAEIPYLLGQQAAGADGRADKVWDVTMLRRTNGRLEYARLLDFDENGRLQTPDALAAGAAAKASIQGPTADRIRAALDTAFVFECKDKPVPVRTVLKKMSLEFQKATDGGLVIKDNLPEGDEAVISVDFYGMPLGAALELIEDATGNRVVVRDYGLVIAPKDQLPPGAPLLHEFWKGAKAEDKPPAKGGYNPGEGRVKEVLVKADGSIGSVLVSLGLGDEVGKGDVLSVFRLEEKDGRAEMIGQLRVVRVGNGESLAEVMGPFNQRIQAGDRVNRMEISPPPKK